MGDGSFCSTMKTHFNSCDCSRCAGEKGVHVETKRPRIPVPPAPGIYILFSTTLNFVSALFFFSRQSQMYGACWVYWSLKNASLGVWLAGWRCVSAAGWWIFFLEKFGRLRSSLWFMSAFQCPFLWYLSGCVGYLTVWSRREYRECVLCSVNGGLTANMEQGISVDPWE